MNKISIFQLVLNSTFYWMELSSTTDFKIELNLPHQVKKITCLVFDLIWKFVVLQKYVKKYV